MELDFEKMGGLVPAIIQDNYTKKVLMLGFMNKEALELIQRISDAPAHPVLRMPWWKLPGSMPLPWAAWKRISCGISTFTEKKIPATSPF